ncbi:MAG: ABC-2 transporter permease [Anaerolineae bacterium]|nr:ABC-2 transporter permease [Anaerolineae bacterium]
MNKILAITRRQLYTTFTDRNLLLIMIAAPLSISTIVGLVFGGFGGGGGFNFSHIPVAVVNLDTGIDQLGTHVNYGDMLVGVMIPQAGSSELPGGAASCPLEMDAQASGSNAFANQSLGDLLAAQSVADAAAGRAGVDNGDFAALVVIPPDFSTRLAPQINATGGEATAAEPAAIEVYANSGQPIEGTIVRSIVEGFTNRLLTGNIAIGASIRTLIQQSPAAALRLAALQNDAQIGGWFACGFSDALATVSVDPQAVQAQQQSRSLTTAILVQTGSAQAVLFAMFAAQFGVLSIISERRAGTLQRMLVSPTPRNVILTGKLFATFVMVIVQLLLLLAALTLIASVVEQQLILIWGGNLIAVAAVILALALSVSGLGVLLMGLAQTPEQVGPVGAVLNIVMGAVGGAFGFPPVIPISYLSLIYWGTDAFGKLAVGSTDIGLNLLALVAAGVVLYGVGLFLFNRRVEL